jgi:hypothetical protein
MNPPPRALLERMMFHVEHCQKGSNHRECPLGEEVELRQLAPLTSGPRFVPTRRRRRREWGTWIGSRQLQVAIF